MSRFATLGTEMRGFAQIPAGSRGLCTNSFDFTGNSEQSYYSVSLVGAREGPFSLKADPDVVSWSYVSPGLPSYLKAKPNPKPPILAFAGHPAPTRDIADIVGYLGLAAAPRPS